MSDTTEAAVKRIRQESPIVDAVCRQLPHFAEGDEAEADLSAWQKGRTGYPIVDAGMRELWATGWMHNRVRMIAASFLIKHLLIDWRRGEQWFWDTLVDADYPQNTVNWQWSAGSGVDANMFVRIMAPLTQSPKFDAGAYIRRWDQPSRASCARVLSSSSLVATATAIPSAARWSSSVSA